MGGVTDAIAHLGLVDEDDLLLDAAALELAALDHPGVSLAPYAALLASMTERLVALDAGALDNAKHARLLAQESATNTASAEIPRPTTIPPMRI